VGSSHDLTDPQHRPRRQIHLKRFLFVTLAHEADVEAVVAAAGATVLRLYDHSDCGGGGGGGGGGQGGELKGSPSSSSGPLLTFDGAMLRKVFTVLASPTAVPMPWDDADEDANEDGSKTNNKESAKSKSKSKNKNKNKSSAKNDDEVDGDEEESSGRFKHAPGFRKALEARSRLTPVCLTPGGSGVGTHVRAVVRSFVVIPFPSSLSFSLAPLF
jgi:hypothetical protein